MANAGILKSSQLETQGSQREEVLGAFVRNAAASFAHFSQI